MNGMTSHMDTGVVGRTPEAEGTAVRRPCGGDALGEFREAGVAGGGERGNGVSARQMFGDFLSNDK